MPSDAAGSILATSQNSAISRRASALTIMLLVTIVVALIVRVALRVGYAGTDDVTYLSDAFEVAAGKFTASEYIGSIRFGVNLSVGALLALFGNAQWVPSIFTLGASLAEILMLYWFAERRFGPRVAIYSAAVLAMVPIHIIAAGIVMPDPANGLVITIAITTFLIAERENRPFLFVISGMAAGAAFWLREATVVFLFFFAVFVLIERRIRARWFISAVAFLCMIGANLAFFWMISGDPFHVFKVLRTFTTSVWSSPVIYSGDPLFYPRYLLLDIRHTSLLGPLALLGLIACAYRREGGDGALWALSLVAVFSLLITSVDPIQFIRKQTNYMAVFLAPLALMAGYMLSRLPVRWGVSVLALHSVLGLALATLSHQNTAAFTAANRQAVRYVAANADLPAFGSRDAATAALYFRILKTDEEPAVMIHAAAPIPGLTRAAGGDIVADRPLRFLQAGLPGDRENSPRPIEVPGCWRAQPAVAVEMRGIPYRLVRSAKSAIDAFPGLPGRSGIDRLLAQLLTPRQLQVFDVPAGCKLLPYGL